MTITEWRHRRYHAMRLMLSLKMPKEEALSELENAYPLDRFVVCDCGRKAPAHRQKSRFPTHMIDTLSWFNFHGMQCRAVGNIPTGSAERRAAR